MLGLDGLGGIAIPSVASPGNGRVRRPLFKVFGGFRGGSLALQMVVQLAHKRSLNQPFSSVTSTALTPLKRPQGYSHHQVAHQSAHPLNSGLVF